MEIFTLLLKDPTFLFALLFFIVGMVVLLWCLTIFISLSKDSKSTAISQYGNPQAIPQETSSSPEIPAPAPILSQKTAPGPTTSPAQPANETDAAVIYSMLEERFIELTKRLNKMESRAASAPQAQKGAPATDLSPLLKKLQEMEAEINNVKAVLAEKPSTVSDGGGSGDFTALTQKVNNLQKILEAVSTETEIAKPS